MILFFCKSCQIFFLCVLCVRYIWQLCRHDKHILHKVILLFDVPLSSYYSRSLISDLCLYHPSMPALSLTIHRHARYGIMEQRSLSRRTNFGRLCKGLFMFLIHRYLHGIERNLPCFFLDIKLWRH